MLVLEGLQTVLLPSVLSNEVPHICLLLNFIQLLFECLRILVNEAKELLSNSHDHVTDVFLPLAQVVLCLIVVKNGLLCEFAHFVKRVERGDIALVNILDILLVNQAGEALEALLLRGVEV